MNSKFPFARQTCRKSLSVLLACGFTTGAFLSLVPRTLANTAEDQPAEKPAIPFSELGARATTDYRGNGMGISASPDGAELSTIFQKLKGKVTPYGLRLLSTEEDGGALHLTARAFGRGSDREALSETGHVKITNEKVYFSRPGLAEEYSVDANGVRQDFVIANRPVGSGELTVELALEGARAETSASGVQLTLDGSGRKLVYGRLQVTDAAGKTLPGRFAEIAPSRLVIAVDDVNATYPVRIDPTFCDADWVSMNSGIPGTNGAVSALAVDAASGTLYIGGGFTHAGAVEAHGVAKWDGSAWSALGEGLEYGPSALAVAGGYVYAAGGFKFAEGRPVAGIARWNGTQWEPVGAGLGGICYTLVAKGESIYAGGWFGTAGGIPAVNIARWNGTYWSALGSGVGNDFGSVDALAFMGEDLYVGGDFSTAGGTTAGYIAKWNGTTWSGVGGGVARPVTALTVHGTDPALVK